MATISIIIVTWKDTAYLKNCLTSLSDLKTKHKVEVIIVDNESTPTSDKNIEKCNFNKYPLTIVKNKENLGFAEGNNVGVRKAKGDYILFLNNDTVVEPDFLDRLVSVLETSEKTAAVQPKILQLDRKNYIDSVGSYFLNTGFLYHLGHNKTDAKQFQKRETIFSMKGACMLFKKSVLDEIGLFDQDFFAYFEETDLCIRTYIAGYDIYYEPSSVIYHKGGGTSQNMQAGFILMHAYKNRLYSYLKNFQFWTLIKIIPIHVFLMLFVSLTYVVTLNFSQAWAIIKAILWNVLNFSKIYCSRTEMQITRKVADVTFLPAVTRRVRLSYYYHLMTTSLAGYNDE